MVYLYALQPDGGKWRKVDFNKIYVLSLLNRRLGKIFIYGLLERMEKAQYNFISHLNISETVYNKKYVENALFYCPFRIITKNAERN